MTSVGYMTEAGDRIDGLMLFDGVCGFCSASVRLTARFDRRGAIRFCPMQSPFRWRLEGWSLGSFVLPRRWAPAVRAMSFSSDGAYRFSVLVAHPWLGVIFPYAGRLT